MLYLKAANYDDIEKEYEFVRDIPIDENGFTNEWNGIAFEEFTKTALPQMIDFSKGNNLPDGYVPETFMFLWKNDEIIGQFRIRHFLCESLRVGAGHIGYFIKKEFRGKGYAKEGLRLTLDIARTMIPEDEIYLRVDKGNTASLKVMLHNGGYIEHEDARKYYVRIAKNNSTVRRDEIIIQTERLLLRPLKITDAEEVFEWVSDERVSRYMVYNTYTDIEQVKKWLAYVEQDKSTYNFGFERISDGKLIGSGDIGLDAQKGVWGFGYNFRYDCWGMGYATEAAKAMMNYVYENFGARNFTSSHCEPNLASGNVMKKCGLHFVRYGEFTKLDGSMPMRSMEYEGEMQRLFW